MTTDLAAGGATCLLSVRATTLIHRVILFAISD